MLGPLTLLCDLLSQKRSKVAGIITGKLANTCHLGDNLIHLNVMGTLSGEIPFCRMQSILAYIDLELNLCFKSDFDLNSIISSDFVGRGRGLPFFFLITVVLPV